MPIDTSIYQQALRPAPTVSDYLGQYQQLAQNKLALASGQQNYNEQTAVIGEKNALRAALGSGQVDLSTPEGRNKLYSVAPTLAPGVLKTMQDQMTAQALAAKDTAQAGNFKSESASTDYKTQQAKSDKAMSDIANFQSPQDALDSLNAHHANGDINDLKYQSVLSTLQPTIQNPQAFGQWKRQMIMGILDAKDRIAATAPKVTMTNTGGAIVPVNENADAGPVGQMAGVAPIKTTASPDTIATQAGENSRATLARKTQLQVAGMDQNGNYMVPTVADVPAADRPGQGAAPGQPAAKSPLQGLVDSIGTYGAPESVALARMTGPAKSAVLDAVRKQYPGYDPAIYAERQAGAHAFAPGGKNGQTIKSLNVGISHLADMSGLVDAINNGDNQTINTVKNSIAAWNDTGSGADVTNLEIAKDIVMNEVVKATAGVAGGQGDRQSAQAALDKVKSMGELKGALKTVTHLMGGQMLGQEQSYKATYPERTDFRTRFMMPSTIQALGGGTAAPAVIPAAPSGFVITHIDGKPQ